MGLRLRYHSALLQPAAAVEEEGEQQVGLEGPRALQEVWLFPSASITWLPVTSTSPTTSFAATNTGRPQRGWPPTAKVGTEKQHDCMFFGGFGVFFADVSDEDKNCSVVPISPYS